jgi:hypothetical protein
VKRYLLILLMGLCLASPAMADETESLTKWLMSHEDAAIDEASAVFQETVAFGIATHWTCIGIGALLSALGLTAVVAGFKFTDIDNKIPCFFLGGCVVVIGMILLGANLYELLHATYAPRHYVLQSLLG